MKICVAGCGRWGSLITWYLAEKKNYDLTLYGRESSKNMQEFLSTRKNSLLTLPESVKLSCDMNCFLDADVIIISINSQGLDAFLKELAPLGLKNKIFGGEGFFNTVITGPGKVTLQTMPIQSVASSLSPYFHSGN